MADAGSMSLPEAASKALAAEHADVLRGGGAAGGAA